MSAAELHSLFGEMLDHVSGRINELCAEWLSEGKDITEIVILIGVKNDGGGNVFSRSRAEFAEHFKGDACAVEVLNGPRNLLPAVFLIVDAPAVHVTWLDPVSSAELH